MVGVEDPVLGQALKAIVALDPGSALGEREIRAHLRAQPSRTSWFPSTCPSSDALPKTDNRQRFSRRAAAELDAIQTHVESRMTALGHAAGARRPTALDALALDHAVETARIVAAIPRADVEAPAQARGSCSASWAGSTRP